MTAISTTERATDASAHAVRLPAHLPRLDGVRGVAIFVVAVHMLSLLATPPDWLGRLCTSLFAYGWMGVQLFFALSGFLITGILLEARGSSNYLSGFYARRFLRIFPLYYGTLFVAFVVLPAVGYVPKEIAHDRPHQIWLWAYVSNWAVGTRASSQALHHFWSLSVEEQFYLIWPFALMRTGPRACLRLCLIVAALALVARLALLNAGVSTDCIYEYSVARMDALALGGAAAAALRIPEIGRRLAASPGRLWATSLAVFVVGAAASHRYVLATFAASSVGYSFLAAAAALVVLAAATSDLRTSDARTSGARTSDVRSPSQSLLLSTPLRALGKYSYAVYVFHKPLHDFVGKPVLARLGLDATRSTPVALAYVAVALTASFGVAFASYHLYEKHFLRRKSRFAPRLASPIPLE
jgi:peptidoglycan/LPS O-acetylase OafA/YrhL